MISHIKVIETVETNPYRNIALEAYLLERVPAGTCILYLWQNRHTVVIGRNQNGWKECRVKELEDSGGFLARRLSGGGAVYHDLGNLNFTFIVREEDYSLDRQMDVILGAVLSLGVDAVKTGRNDIETAGRKFSGNAFHRSGGSAYHHGTLLVNADKTAAARYLSASKEKIQSKGVESVASRIINLTECNPGITIATLKEALKVSFNKVYALKAEISLIPEGGNAPEMGNGEPGRPPHSFAELEKQFSSPEWLYGKNPPFTYGVERRFPWGSVELLFDVINNKISAAQVFSDSMDGDFFSSLAQRLIGAGFTYKALFERIAHDQGKDAQVYAADIAGMIFENQEAQKEG
jgi:lipoate-protein ligase A